MPIPDYLGSTINFQLYVTNATVDVIARKHWVLATSPPSEAETLPGSNERRRVVQSEEAVDEGAIQVELAGPLFRSKPGALLLGLSAWDPLFFVVAALFGWLQDALKKLFGGLFGRILRRGGAPTPERPPPAPS